MSILTSRVYCQIETPYLLFNKGEDVSGHLAQPYNGKKKEMIWIVHFHRYLLHGRF